MSYELIAPFGDDVDYRTFSPEPYDASGGEPEAWRLFVRLTAPGRSIVGAIAGQFSTVPPDEVPPSGIPVKIPGPDGKLAATDDRGLLTALPATIPESTTLYLSPFQGAGSFAFALSLQGAGFGTEIRWLKYTNVDVESLRQLALAIPRIGLENMTDDDVFAAFVAGELTAEARPGVAFGSVSATAGGGIMEFAVHTDVGYADPVAMWRTLNPPSRFGTIDTSWPYLSGSDAHLATVTSLFPMPVLHHARIVYQLNDVEWRALGDTQKALYWARLRAKYVVGDAPPFLFSREDMANVFQLEALVEFYLAYPRPAQGGLVPDGPSTPVDLIDSSTTWHFVFLEPFVDLLRAKEMIGPQYALNSFTLKNVVYQDRFDAVLFLVYKGIPRRWHRWTTYTAHSWLTRNDQKSLEQQSSVVGNVPYTFESRNGATTAAINYAFIVFDHHTENGAEQCPGRFYSSNDLHDDPNGKTEVMVHVAYTDTATHPQDYSGSAGCLVSPSFMRLRDQMLGYLSTTTHWNPKLEQLRGASLGRSAEIYNADLKVFEDKQKRSESIINVWNRAFQGKLWLVRPDEATNK